MKFPSINGFIGFPSLNKSNKVKIGPPLFLHWSVSKTFCRRAVGKFVKQSQTMFRLESVGISSVNLHEHIRVIPITNPLIKLTGTVKHDILKFFSGGRHNWPTEMSLFSSCFGILMTNPQNIIVNDLYKRKIS